MESRLSSEEVIVSAPMSFHGSAARIWRITDNKNTTAKLLLVLLALWLIFMAWIIVLCWYLVFGILLVPYRLIRRSSRKNKRDSLRHRELLSTIEKKQ